VKRWMAVLVAVPAVLIASVTAYFVRDAHRQAQAVEELCRREGGLHVYKTTYVHGYLDAMSSGDFPERYVQELVAGRFEYVDFVHKHPGARFAALKTPGYYRTSIQNIDDPRCVYRFGESLPHSPSAAQQGVPPGRCLALERLVDAPEHYEYSHGFKEFTAANGVVAGANEQLITHWPTGEVYAREINVIASTRLHEMLEMSGGGVNPDYACYTANPPGTTVDEFIALVLRDKKRLGKEN